MSQNVVICLMALVTVWLKNQIAVAMGEKIVGSKNRVYIERGHCELLIELLWGLVVDR